MSRMRHSDFIGPKFELATTRYQRLAEWRKASGYAYDIAKLAKCVCVPTRAQLLLIEQFDGNGPDHLKGE